MWLPCRDDCASLAVAARGGASVTSDMAVPFLLTGGSGVRGLALGRVKDRLEAAPEHPLAGKGHLALGLQRLVGHDLFPSLVARVLVGPFDEGKDDILAILGLH